MLRVKGIARLALVMGGLLLGTGTASATVLWTGDYSTGNISQWTGAEEVNPDRLEVMKDPLGSGNWVLQATVVQGDNPINASGNRNELFYEGDNVNVGNGQTERFYYWRTMWPTDYVSADTWQLFTQWHQYDGGGSPPVEFYLNGENVMMTVLSVCGGDNCSAPTWQTPLQRGVWHDFVLDVNWSEDPSLGYFQLWYDGQQVIPKTTAATLLPGGDGVYLKQGLYRNADITQTQEVYHTGMTIATTLADALQKQAQYTGSAADAGSPETTAADASTGGTTTTASATSSSTSSSTTDGSTGASTQERTTTAQATTSSETGSGDHPATGCAQTGTSGAALLVLLGVTGLALRKRRRGAPVARS